MEDHTGDLFDQLFGQAEQELKDEEVPEEWGELRSVAEGERVLARYIGEDVLPPFSERVYRFVDYVDGGPFYLKHKAQLGKALEPAAVGDIVGLVRGVDKDIGKDNPMETWRGWARSPDKQPTADTKAAPTPLGDDEELPF